MALAERDVQLQRVEAQNDLLCEKVKVLTDSLFHKDTQNHPTSRSHAQPVGWKSHGTLHSCSGDDNVSARDDHHSVLTTSMEEAPSMQSAVLAAQCKALECEMGTLRADRDALERKLERSTRGATTLPLTL